MAAEDLIGWNGSPEVLRGRLDTAARADGGATGDDRGESSCDLELFELLSTGSDTLSKITSSVVA